MCLLVAKSQFVDSNRFVNRLKTMEWHHNCISSWREHHVHTGYFDTCRYICVASLIPMSKVFLWGVLWCHLFWNTDTINLVEPFNFTFQYPDNVTIKVCWLSYIILETFSDTFYFMSVKNNFIGTYLELVWGKYNTNKALWCNLTFMGNNNFPLFECMDDLSSKSFCQNCHFFVFQKFVVNSLWCTCLWHSEWLLLLYCCALWPIK